ncbi:uncharacterized protein LOC106158544 isoform X2 [Lingula anatina]|uniref:Uncharacterized protein LOC106158544 isoform X2 n=1 Tax=Lingula anatina TaxID=7574 RepID=A0A1S3HVI0_LINAN|nr:uncharacterized protein LOC106158544 isoform X2 [Lingula anatina]|eukprot:XP_013390047.1 uncharacterized protein LOC106158544 isoform X2 [Lingula anatina]
MSKRSRRYESKKRKAKAFLDLVKANEEDGLKGNKRKMVQQEQVTLDSSSSDSESLTDRQGSVNHSSVEDADLLPKEKQRRSTVNKQMQDGEPPTKKLNISEDEYARIRAEIRARQKEAMQRPKIFLTLDDIQPYVPTPQHFPTIPPQISGKEELEMPSYQPHLFMLDVQHLLLYAIQGNTASYKPRWCKLLRWQKVSHIAVVTVQGLSFEEYTQHKDCFQHLGSFDVEVGLVSPYQYGSSVEEDLFQVPLSSSYMKKLGIKENGGEKLNKKKKTATSEDGEQQGQDKRPSDCCCRTTLMLRPEQLIQEDYPLPVDGDGERCANYVFSKDSYGKVTNSSPLFAVDCEMCLTKSAKRLELTRVSVVNEKAEVIYDQLVKPRHKIINYLTKYSGITEQMLAPVTTTLQDVQRDLQNLFPSDAILCGQSLNGDLHALELFHPYCIDTSVIYNLSGHRKMKTGLKRLAAQFLGRTIQDSSAGHDSAEDAIAALDLVLLKLKNNISYGDVIMGGVIYPKLEDKPPVIAQVAEAAKPVQISENSVNTPSDSLDSINNSQSSDAQASTTETRMEVKPLVSTDLSSVNQSAGFSNLKAKDSNMTDKNNSATLKETSNSCLQSTDSKTPSEGKCVTSLGMTDKKKVFFRGTSQAYQSLVGILTDFCKTSVCISRSDDKLGNHKMEFYPCSSDKRATKIAKKKVVDSSFTFVEFNGFDPSEKDTGKTKESLQDIDRRISKIHQKMPNNGMFVVILGGRTSESSAYSAGAFVSIKKSTCDIST